MQKIKILGQTVQPGELGQTHRSTDERTVRRTLPSALSPCFAVDNHAKYALKALSIKYKWTIIEP